MSKADQLGSGRFGNTQGVSARRQAVAAATGAATVGAPDSRLQTIPLEQLVPTRFNPRRDFGSKEKLLEFGLKIQKKQLAPAVAVTRDAYLRLWKEEASNVGTARYVLANGERRFRSSKEAGSATLEVIVDDTIAASRATFLDAVLSENNDREDLNPIERALGIETMVAELGGADKVAEHYSKTKGWVSQQRKLLKLTSEMQDLVSSGELPIRVARDIAGLPATAQPQAWEDEQKKRQDNKSSRKASVQAKPATERSAKEQRFTAVNQLKPESVEPTPRLAAGAANPPSSANSTEAGQSKTALPEPRQSGPAEPPTEDGQPEEAGISHPESAWPLPPDWKVLAKEILAQYPEFDRHMLTKGLSKMMEDELGATADNGSSESASA
ncbi:ParB/RepB/Spo0J family partition protein [Streptomyces sp. NPDC050529]|uniref:ParB/RepB/Spo0J family partition protein n=1 Tax=Streptomyces sp. NPDC050529 TaxID=3365624 RepID=UPI0037991523